MICTRCNYEPCQCHAEPGSKQKGQTLRVNRCDVPSCQRIVSAGDPDKNLSHGLRLPTRCRFHRDQDYRDPPAPESSPVLPNPGPLMSLEEFGREEFDRIRKASGQALRDYWKAHSITVRPPGPVPKGWDSAGKTLRKWADKWFPPIP